MKGVLLLPAALLAIAAAHATPQDPARVDGTAGHDPADVFAAPAAPAQRILPRRASAPTSASAATYGVDTAALHRQWRELTTRPPQDYEAAYGNANIRQRLGRTYAGTGGGVNGNAFSLQGSQIQALSGRLFSGQNGAMPGLGNLDNADAARIMHSLQGTANDIGRQLMPALQDARRELDVELNRAAARQRSR
ncbi:hypothetical protein [Luteimonas aquatica]|uniref:hypothetical protein n=1 Tax=Luteimonas aquatica TaxID=450364 RepID=UPI001F579B21|nr:hypothetical protein [Luteimonas aquatica]